MKIKMKNTENFTELFESLSILSNLTRLPDKAQRLDPLPTGNFIKCMEQLTLEAGFGNSLSRPIERMYFWKEMTGNCEVEEPPLILTHLCEATSIVRNESICSKRRRSHLPQRMKQQLEQIFSLTPHPSRTECDNIAKAWQLTPRQVRVWVCSDFTQSLAQQGKQNFSKPYINHQFTNKRYRTKPRDMKQEMEELKGSVNSLTNSSKSKVEYQAHEHL